jgi:hypothetical protein
MVGQDQRQQTSADQACCHVLSGFQVLEAVHWMAAVSPQPALHHRLLHACLLDSAWMLAGRSVNPACTVSPLQGLQTTRLGLAVQIGIAVVVAGCAAVASAYIALSIRGC